MPCNFCGGEEHTGGYYHRTGCPVAAAWPSEQRIVLPPDERIAAALERIAAVLEAWARPQMWFADTKDDRAHE